MTVFAAMTSTLSTCHPIIFLRNDKNTSERFNCCQSCTKTVPLLTWKNCIYWVLQHQPKRRMIDKWNTRPVNCRLIDIPAQGLLWGWSRLISRWASLLTYFTTIHECEVAGVSQCSPYFFRLIQCEAGHMFFFCSYFSQHKSLPMRKYTKTVYFKNVRYSQVHKWEP